MGGRPLLFASRYPFPNHVIENDSGVNVVLSIVLTYNTTVACRGNVALSDGHTNTVSLAVQGLCIVMCG
jgi:hypothetical protein